MTQADTNPESLRSCPPAPRRARVERKTRESDIVVDLNLDGTGTVDIDTGVPFFDHMLTALGVHGSFDLTVIARGDVEIEAHHTVEDTAIVLGTALGQALGGERRVPEPEVLDLAVGVHAEREAGDPKHQPSGSVGGAW